MLSGPVGFALRRAALTKLAKAAHGWRGQRKLKLGSGQRRAPAGWCLGTSVLFLSNLITPHDFVVGDVFEAQLIHNPMESIWSWMEPRKW